MGTQRAPNPAWRTDSTWRESREPGDGVDRGQGEGPGLEPYKDLILKNGSCTHTQGAAQNLLKVKGVEPGSGWSNRMKARSPPPL